MTPTKRSVILDFVERAGWSAGQVFVATLLAGGTNVVGLPWSYAATLGGSAAVVSVVLTALQYIKRWATDLPFWLDLGARLVKTFLGSLAGSMMAGVFDITTFDWGAALNVAFLAVLAVLGKGLLAREHPAPAAAGDKVSPSTLPAATYDEAVKPVKPDVEANANANAEAEAEERTRTGS